MGMGRSRSSHSLSLQLCMELPMEYYTSKNLANYLSNPANERDLRDRAESGWQKKDNDIRFDDAYQQSHLKLYTYVLRTESDSRLTKIKKENEEPFPFRYLFKVLRNTLLAESRRPASQKMYPVADFLADWAIFDPGLEKRWVAVQLAVSKLCTSCVELLYYRFELGYSKEDLRVAFGLSKKSIKDRLQKCLTKLRQFVDDCQER